MNDEDLPRGGDGTRRLHDLEQSFAALSENFPPCWRRIYLKSIEEGFTHEEAFRLFWRQAMGMTATRYIRRVIRITAEDSPNVRYARQQEALGIEPTDEMVIPGVLSWAEFQRRLKTWDKSRQIIGLRAEFDEGADLMMFPEEWLIRAEELAVALEQRGTRRVVRAIGIDPGEGVANSPQAAVDDYGLVDLDSMKTPDTTKIVSNAIAFMRKHNVSADKTGFDVGGGGLQHAQRLRVMGYNVTTVSFGGTLDFIPKRGMRMFKEKVEHREEKQSFKNRRAEMFIGGLMYLLDPALNPKGFAIPFQRGGPYARLRHQLKCMPKQFQIPGTDKVWSYIDEEGRYQMLPKTRKPGSQLPSLTDLIGYSPDEADALAVAVYVRDGKASPARAYAGAV